MRKKILKNLLKTCVITALSTLTFNNAQAQYADGDWRTVVSGRSWWNNTSSTTYNMYNASTQTWGLTGGLYEPTASTNLTIRDGQSQTSTHSGTSSTGNLVNNLYLGEGGGVLATATITGGVVTAITVTDPGSLVSVPSVTFLGAATTLATATPFLKVTGAALNSVGGTIAGGTAYTNAIVTFGTTAWALSTAYNTIGTQRFNNGNLYTVATAGTSDVSGGPNGTGSNITDGTVVWNYNGPAATATATISGGSITGITITNSGSGYTSMPTLTITGDGTGASYSPKLSVESVIITNGGAGYTTAPDVLMGANITIGNKDSSGKRLSSSGNVVFTKGSYLFTAGINYTETLNIGGNLSAVTPIIFKTYSGPNTSNTNVVFTKQGTSSTSGAKMTFNNLTVNLGNTLNITNEVVVLGNLVNNGTINVTGSSPLTVVGTTSGTGTISGTGTLPVKLTSFTAKATSNHINVSWATSSEINNDKFVVERATDGKTFSKIAEVKAQGPSAYSIIDNSPAKGTNYYRLVQYDLDGKSEVFGPVAVNFDLKASTSLMAYPNPTPGSISFNADGLNGNIEASLLDMSGKVIYQESINNTGERNYTLNMKQKPVAGQYILQVNGKGFNKSTMIVVL